MKKSYAHWVGALQGATRIALIHLEHDRADDAAYVLRNVLAQVDEDLLITIPERTSK
jgi:hypothetical protein